MGKVRLWNCRIGGLHPERHEIQHENEKNNFMNRLEFLNRGLQTKQGITDIPLPSNNFPALSMEFQGVPWPDGIHKYSSRLWVCSRISSQLDLPRGRQKGGILIRYLNHLSWNILT